LKVILNCSTNHIGGAVQVASSLIKESIKHPYDIQWFYILSKPVAENISDYLNKLDKKSCIIIDKSPARIVKGFQTRKVIKDFEKKLNPDLIFTVFGPSYINFKSPHLCGFADAWFTDPNDYALNTLSFQSKILLKLKYIYKGMRLRRRDFYWTETTTSKNGLTKKLRINTSHIGVIPNTASDYFWNYYGDLKDLSELNFTDRSTFHVVMLSAPYPHKNFSIIPGVAKKLNEQLSAMGKKCVFHVTFPESDNSILQQFWKDVANNHSTDFIINHGYLKSIECLELLKKADVLFLPTLIETFSVTYLEAMLTRTLIVTSNMDFAKEICGSAAEYFHPLNPDEAVAKLYVILTNNRLKHDQLVNADLQLRKFVTTKQKYDLHVDLIRTVSKKLLDFKI